jgi:hypothetical protein
MKYRLTWFALALLLVVPNGANAHTHVWDVFFGPSYLNGSHLAGVHVNLAVAPAPAGSALKRVSFVFDTSVHRGGHETDRRGAQPESLRLTRVAVSGGVRITPHRGEDRHLTAVQFLLISKVWDRMSSENEGRLGFAPGLIYEYLLNESEGKGWAFRTQGDVILTKLDNFPRLSAGLAYHWK